MRPSDQVAMHLLRAKNVPQNLPHLDVAWRPGVDGSYISESPGDMSLMFCKGQWCIIHDICGCIAVAQSHALHPNTVLPGEWRALVAWPRTWRKLPDFYILSDAECQQTSYFNPLALCDVGEDWFTRVAMSRPVWWTLYPTSHAQHSASKLNAITNTHGTRFCHICRKNISANNFHSQHLAKHYQGEFATLRPTTRRRQASCEGDVGCVATRKRSRKG